jgi:acetamidase/formamidase
MEGARLATLQMIDLLGRQHGLSEMDAYLLCSVCADLVISELVNRPVHVVSLYFPRIVFE